MRYTGFEIKNFKGIKHMKLDLSGTPDTPVHVFVGLNESGKTTILEAINFFSQGSDLLGPGQLSGSLQMDVHQLIPISERANFNGNIEIAAELEIDTSDTKALKAALATHGFNMTGISSPSVKVRDIHTFENSRFVTTNRTLNVVVFGRTGRQRTDRAIRGQSPEWQTVSATLMGRMPKIWYFPDFLFKFPERIYLQESDKDDDTHRFYRALLQDILDYLQNGTNIKDHIVARAESAEDPDKKAMESLLLLMGRCITDTVFGAWDEIFKRVPAKKEVILDIKKDADGPWYLFFRIKDADGLFTVDERSLGFRWFFVYLLLTSFRGSRRDSPGELLFLFDEPASNLHSSAQSQLLKSFETLMNRCSIVYTTHSHYLINPMWLENTYVVRNLGLDYTERDDEAHAKKTDVRATLYREFAAQYPDQATYFQPILEVLEYRPSNLENVPRVVMVEGKNDFYVLRYLAKEVLRVGDELNPLPGGGAGSLDDLISLYVGWAREFLVLLDGDEEGRRQKERYIEKFGGLVEGRIVTLADVNSEWIGKEMEDLLEEADRLAIQRVAYPAEKEYKKNYFHRAVQEVNVTKVAVKVSRVSRGRFEELRQFLVAAMGDRTTGGS